MHFKAPTTQLVCARPEKRALDEGPQCVSMQGPRQGSNWQSLSRPVKYARPSLRSFRHKKKGSLKTRLRRG